MICATVARYYGPEPSSLAHRRDPHIALSIAAWICRRHAEAPFRDLAGRFGLSSADSVPNLTRRVDTKLPKSPDLSEEVRQILGIAGRRIRPRRDS